MVVAESFLRCAIIVVKESDDRARIDCIVGWSKLAGITYKGPMGHWLLGSC
jgi:hypothetical protein